MRRIHEIVKLTSFNKHVFLFQVVARLPVAPVWSLLFFVMLLTLGLDSQFALMETVTTAILDGVPSLRLYKIWVVLVVSILGYFGGIIFTTNVPFKNLLISQWAGYWRSLERLKDILQSSVPGFLLFWRRFLS